MEVADPALAVELWIQLRHLHDWLTGPDTRVGLFHAQPTEAVLERRSAALRAAGDWGESLDVFHALTDGFLPTPERIAHACVNVADWASRMGYEATAVQFSAAAAHAEPANATCLNAAGLMHRRSGQWVAAELLYQRASYFACRLKNTDERVSAHIGLAALWFSRDNYRRARKHLDRATNIALRSGSTWLAAHAQHDLMLMLTERGEYIQAEAVASRAVSLYPQNDSRFPFFAADFAFLLISEGCYSDAVSTLEQFLTLIKEPAQQIIGLSLLARAYAGSGKDSEFRRVQDTVRKLITVFQQDAAAALYHLAEAARSRGEWSTAATYATESQRTALARGDKVVARYADTLLTAILRQQDAARAARAENSGTRRATTNALSARLRRWAPASKRGRPRHPRRNHWG
jgi:tetratricopeptide (TPR) repeat protein